MGKVQEATHDSAFLVNNTLRDSKPKADLQFGGLSRAPEAAALHRGESGRVFRAHSGRSSRNGTRLSNGVGLGHDGVDLCNYSNLHPKCSKSSPILIKALVSFCAPDKMPVEDFFCPRKCLWRAFVFRKCLGRPWENDVAACRRGRHHSYCTVDGGEYANQGAQESHDTSVRVIWMEP